MSSISKVLATCCQAFNSAGLALGIAEELACLGLRELLREHSPRNRARELSGWMTAASRELPLSMLPSQPCPSGCCRRKHSRCWPQHPQPLPADLCCGDHLGASPWSLEVLSCLGGSGCSPSVLVSSLQVLPGSTKLLCSCARARSDRG